MIQRHRICFLFRFPQIVISCKILFQYQNHIPCIVTVNVKNNQVTTRSLYYSHFFFQTFSLIYFNFWLCWISIALHRLSLVAESGSLSSLQGWGFSLGGFSRGRHRSQAHGLQWFRYACCWLQLAGQNQGLNSCSLHWKADSYPLSLQGSPVPFFFRHPYLHPELFMVSLTSGNH